MEEFYLFFSAAAFIICAKVLASSPLLAQLSLKEVQYTIIFEHFLTIKCTKEKEKKLLFESSLSMTCSLIHFQLPNTKWSIRKTREENKERKKEAPISLACSSHTFRWLYAQAQLFYNSKTRVFKQLLTVVKQCTK